MISPRRLVRVTGLVVKLTPLGVFALAAAAAGTMTIDELGRLQVYMVNFIVACVFLTFGVLPVSFNYPLPGKLLMLLFVLFAGWFTGSPIGIEQYAMFTMAGLFSFFGGIDIAIPFMLDLMRLPADMYQLYDYWILGMDTVPKKPRWSILRNVMGVGREER